MLEFVLFYDGKPSYVVSIMEFRQGLVAHETQYFSDRFEPSSLRANLVNKQIPSECLSSVATSQ